MDIILVGQTLEKSKTIITITYTILTVCLRSLHVNIRVNMSSNE